MSPMKCGVMFESVWVEPFGRQINILGGCILDRKKAEKHLTEFKKLVEPGTILQIVPMSGNNTPMLMGNEEDIKEFQQFIFAMAESGTMHIKGNDGEVRSIDID